MNKLCLIGDGYTRLTDLDRETIKRLRRLPGYDTLRIVLAKKAILVEGPSDELIIKRLFLDKFKKLPEELGIEIIVVGGLGFKNYLNIAKIVGTRTHVIRDNDGSYEANIEDWFTNYRESKHLTISAPTSNTLNSLEPALIEANGETEEQLNSFASIILSPQKKREYDQAASLTDKKQFLRIVFEGDGGKKVDSAMRIFECKPNSIIYPSFLLKALALAE
jgi:predicted ATP-dependent endonuclease of OLD family